MNYNNERVKRTNKYYLQHDGEISLENAVKEIISLLPEIPYELLIAYNAIGDLAYADVTYIEQERETLYLRLSLSSLGASFEPHKAQKKSSAKIELNLLSLVAERIDLEDVLNKTKFEIRKLYPA